LIAARVANPEDSFDVDDVMVIVATNAYIHAVGRADSGLLYGNRDLFQSALDLLRQLIAASADSGQLSTWWVSTLTSHLQEDLWDSSLHQRLPQEGPRSGQEGWQELRSKVHCSDGRKAAAADGIVAIATRSCETGYRFDRRPSDRTPG
jgi:hypothetical protein